MHAHTFYIDESGHTGDLVKADEDFAFAGQPHFILGAIGPTSPEQAAEVLREVVARHRLKMQEVKSDQLQKRPGFAKDLVNALRAADIPIFVEAVDKRFFMIMNMVNTQVMPPSSGYLLGPMDQVVRNMVADLMYDRLPNTALRAFSTACVTDSAETTRCSMESLLSFARDEKSRNGPLFEAGDAVSLLRTIEDMMVRSIAAFDVAAASDVRAYRAYLPLPDAGKRVTQYWLLPNYSSLTNLYARINRFQRGELDHLVLIHDEQAQYDEILVSAKSAVEALVDTPGHIFPSATYSFDQSAQLVFSPSADTPGLMIADVIAGHIRRLLRDFAAGKPIHDDAWDAAIAIWNDPSLGEGPGLNLVLATQSVRSMQLAAINRTRDQHGESSSAREADLK